VIKTLEASADQSDFPSSSCRNSKS